MQTVYHILLRARRAAWQTLLFCRNHKHRVVLQKMLWHAIQLKDALGRRLLFAAIVKNMLQNTAALYISGTKTVRVRKRELKRPRTHKNMLQDMTTLCIPEP